MRSIPRPHGKQIDMHVEGGPLASRHENDHLAADMRSPGGLLTPYCLDAPLHLGKSDQTQRQGS